MDNTMDEKDAKVLKLPEITVFIIACTSLIDLYIYTNAQKLLNYRAPNKNFESPLSDVRKI